MTKAAPVLRAMWAVFGVVAAVLLVFATAADGLVFALAYGGPAGSYTGQAADRHLAWSVLIWLLIAWVFVLVAMIWPALRWRRRGKYATPGQP